METVVVSVGGSILLPEGDDPAFVRNLAELLLKVSERARLYIVAGGGRIARFYIDLGRKLGADESFLDDMGIDTTRLNAKLLIAALGARAYHQPAATIEEALGAGKSHEIVVTGGFHVSMTTDACAALLAERLKAARLINATSVDGVYTADPAKDRSAQRLSTVSHAELVALVQKDEHRAGPNVVFDPLGAKIIARAKIPMVVLDGRDLLNLRRAILGEPCEGTRVGEAPARLKG